MPLDIACGLVSVNKCTLYVRRAIIYAYDTVVYDRVCTCAVHTLSVYFYVCMHIHEGMISTMTEEKVVYM